LPPVIALCIIVAGLLIQACRDVITSERGGLPAWFASYSILVPFLAVPALLAMLVQLVLAALG